MERKTFWGKLERERGAQLPLAAHCLDVALVFRHLLSLPAFRQRLARAEGQELTEAHLDRLAILAALHDAGKANWGFQEKASNPNLKAGHIRELEAVCACPALSERFCQAMACQELLSWFAREEALEELLLASWSHHGRPLQFKGEKSGNFFLAKTWWQPQGELDPMAAVEEIFTWARGALPLAFTPAPPLQAPPPFQHLFAGLLMLADWLGSHPDWFPIGPCGFEERLAQDQSRIPQLLHAVGLTPLLPARALPSFGERFGFAPRPMQAQLAQLDLHEEACRLLILEAETGSGKTEAALEWFFRLYTAGKVSGLYFALPTRVAARELYRRVLAYIQRWFPEPFGRPVTVLAVPGYPQVDGLPPEAYLPGEEQLWQEDLDIRQRERTWAAERPKRFLAATVAVGTIDQALLAAVQTAHAHLRLACLSRHLLVVDEVHASDIYMGKLLQALLKYHLGLGGYALLLSATLGAEAKAGYLHAAGCPPEKQALPKACAVPYPALTLGNGQTLQPPASSAHKDVRFELLPLAFRLREVGQRVSYALGCGAKVLVILNTVARANAFLRAMEEQLAKAWLFSCQGVLCPHHGRFAPADRLVLDQAVTAHFGKDSGPGPLLLVGTQTLEQSLDLDADLLITDLAPMDVLLQRVGRLHRHRRPRPTEFSTALCLVLVPETELESALDSRGEVAGLYKGLGLGSVYPDLRVLELTKQVLLKKPQARLPQDNRLFVESALHPDALAILAGEKWQRHGAKIEGEELMKAISSHQATIDFSVPFGELAFAEAGERVVTRLGTDSWELAVDPPFLSPFGQQVDRLLIPGHLKPAQGEEKVQVLAQEGSQTLLACGEKRYRYSRFGLEEEDIHEPAQ
jgi:CRISPR-associated endonuclease/helicase Cas3